MDDFAQTPPVRIVEVHRNALHVVGNAIDEKTPVIPDATIGDWLLLDRTDPQASRVLDRASLLKRWAPGTGRNVQLIAANIDTAFIVSSCNPDFNIARLERYVAMVLDAEIAPVIVLTKSDLVASSDNYVTEAQSISDLVPVVVLDARGDEPEAKLGEWCKPGKTVAFLGSSGVGKSTLTNALAGSQSIETQAIRENDAKGRHTTTRRQLHIVASGCIVLDTPGMRELQLTDAAAGIGDLFADIDALTGQCRFNDCQHLVEPGCAILKAVESGEVDEARLGRWRKLIDEDASNAPDLTHRKSNDKSTGQTSRISQNKSKKRG